MLKRVIDTGQALDKFKEMVKYQHGNDEYIGNPELFTKAKLIIEVKAKQAGYIQTLEAKTLGIVSMKLGGGRQTKDDVIDHSVGIILNKKCWRSM